LCRASQAAVRRAPSRADITTFILPSELGPVTMRATGHGISAVGPSSVRLPSDGSAASSELQCLV